MLLLGASGFIGERLLEALRAAGHEVICGMRRGRDPVAMCAALAARDPSVRAMPLDGAVMFCTEALSVEELDEIGDAVGAIWPTLADG